MYHKYTQFRVRILQYRSLPHEIEVCELQGFSGCRDLSSRTQGACQCRASSSGGSSPHFSVVSSIRRAGGVHVWGSYPNFNQHIIMRATKTTRTTLKTAATPPGVTRGDRMPCAPPCPSHTRALASICSTVASNRITPGPGQVQSLLHWCSATPPWHHTACDHSDPRVPTQLQTPGINYEELDLETATIERAQLLQSSARVSIG
jgi:hypothetical protein